MSDNKIVFPTTFDSLKSENTRGRYQRNALMPRPEPWTNEIILLSSDDEDDCKVIAKLETPTKNAYETHVESVKQTLLTENISSPVDPIAVKVYKKMVDEDAVAMSILESTSELNLSAQDTVKKLTQVFKHID